MLLGNVDVLMLSQYSDDAVAAVGLSNQIIAVGIMILGIVSLGSSIQLYANNWFQQRDLYKF